MKNSQLPVRIVTVLFAVCALASTKLATAGEAASAKTTVAPNVKSGLPDKAIPQGIGFNVHIMGPDRDWDEIKAAGVEFIRTDFSWDRIERTKGQYDFDAYDRMLESLEARGIRVDFGLQYRNKLYPDPETTEEGREAYAKFAAASAKHFKGRGVIWEIWNEPNVDFWKGKGEMNSAEFASEYMALVKRTVPAMRAADPDCFILGGAVSCLWVKSFQWIDEVFKQGLLKTGINALSVHPYGFSRPELCVESGRPDQGYAPPAREDGENRGQGLSGRELGSGLRYRAEHDASAPSHALCPHVPAGSYVRHPNDDLVQLGRARCRESQSPQPRPRSPAGLQRVQEHGRRVKRLSLCGKAQGRFRPRSLSE